MVSPAASCPKTALTVTRVSLMQGRPLIRFGSTVIRSYATVSEYAPGSRAPSATHRPWSSGASLIATVAVATDRDPP